MGIRDGQRQSSQTPGRRSPSPTPPHLTPFPPPAGSLPSGRLSVPLAGPALTNGTADSGLGAVAKSAEAITTRSHLNWQGESSMALGILAGQPRAVMSHVNAHLHAHA